MGVIAVPVIFILGYLAVNYDSGTADPAVLAGIEITYKDQYQSHVHNNTGDYAQILDRDMLSGRRRATGYINRETLSTIATGIRRGRIR